MIIITSFLVVECLRTFRETTLESEKKISARFYTREPFGTDNNNKIFATQFNIACVQISSGHPFLGAFQDCVIAYFLFFSSLEWRDMDSSETNKAMPKCPEMIERQNSLSRRWIFINPCWWKFLFFLPEWPIAIFRVCLNRLHISLFYFLFPRQLWKIFWKKKEYRRWWKIPDRI